MVWLPERDREENRGNPLNTQPQAESSVIRSSKPKVKGMQTEAHFGFFISQLPKMVLSHLLLGYLVSRRSLPASDVNLGAGWISDIVHRPLHPSPHPRCPSGNSSLSSKQFKKGFVYCILPNINCIHYISPFIFFTTYFYCVTSSVKQDTILI